MKMFVCDEPPAFIVSNIIFTITLELAIRAKLMMNAISITFTGASLISVTSGATIHARAIAVYDTNKATKIRAISTNDDSLSTLEYVRNILKNTRLTTIVSPMVLHIVAESSTRLLKSYRSAYANRRESPIITTSMASIIQMGNTLTDKYLLTNFFML